MSRSPSVTAFYIRLLFSEKEQKINILIFKIKVNTVFLSLHEKIKSLKSNVSEYSTFISISIINVLLLIFFISTDTSNARPMTRFALSRQHDVSESPANYLFIQIQSAK
jgi:hypothetical protein